MDYDACINSVLLDEQRTKGIYYVRKKDIARWFVVLMIGILTALVACAIDGSIERLSFYKFSYLQNVTDDCVEKGCLGFSYFIWILINIFGVFIAAVLGSLVEVIFYVYMSKMVVNYAPVVLLQ